MDKQRSIESSLKRIISSYSSYKRHDVLPDFGHVLDLQRDVTNDLEVIRDALRLTLAGKAELEREVHKLIDTCEVNPAAILLEKICLYWLYCSLDAGKERVHWISIFFLFLHKSNKNQNLEVYISYFAVSAYIYFERPDVTSLGYVLCLYVLLLVV